jgi:hypothetical protein
MFKASVIILLAAWLCLAGFIGINMYRQYQVGKVQMRILNDYKQMSELDNIFKTVQDSLHRDATTLEKQVLQMSRPFPLQNQEQNWLLLKVGVIVLTLLSMLTYWLHYKKPRPE